MTNKQMETKNRRTRIVKALLAQECKRDIAKREGISVKQIEHIGEREAIPRCSHARAGHFCIKPGEPNA